jgi:two-component system, OmpR family, response regulator
MPILMLTAKSDDIDRIVGLELGADDYMGKPFNPRELLARIRAILRRQDTRSEANRRVSVGSITVDLDKRAVTTFDGNAIDLTAADFDLLECFVTRPGRVLSRDQLMDWTRGRRANSLDRTIDVQVSRLRKKIETGDAPMIKTLRNAGYMLVAEVTPL